MATIDFDSLNFKEKLKNIFTFDLIRLQKLLEISQSMILGLVCGFYMGYLIDHLFPVYVESENKSNIKLFMEVMLQMIVLGIGAYYIKKILRLIPFLFKLSSDYVPSLKKEGLLGLNVGMGLIFVSNQTNLREKLVALRERMFGE